MSVVSDNVNKIRTAIYGEQVRSAIADSIEAIDSYATGNAGDMVVDFSKGPNSLSVYDQNRLVESKRYATDGLIDDSSFVSLEYLIPINKGDIIYQNGGGYLHFAFYDSMFSYVGASDSTSDPLEVSFDGVTYLGISLDISRGSDPKNRTVRINHRITGGGITDYFDIIYKPHFSVVDYSKNENVWNLIDATRIVEGKRYTSTGLVNAANYESLNYLIPVKQGDVVYQGGGRYLDIAFYDRYGVYVTSYIGGTDPYTVPADAELMGVSINGTTGAKLRSRILRINHSIIGVVSPNNFVENRYFDRPTILIDFDQPPTVDNDLRFSIMDEYGWTATTPIPFENPSADDCVKIILNHGWSLSLYRSYPDYMEPSYSESNFDQYVRETLEFAYEHNLPNAIQWSARQNLSYDNLRKILIKYGIPVIRWNSSGLKFMQDKGDLIELEACEINSSRLATCKNRIDELISNGNGVLNIYTHYVYTSSESGESYQCPEETYRSLCDYIKEKEEANLIDVSNSTRWFAKHYPDRDHVYRDRSLYNMTIHNN